MERKAMKTPALQRNRGENAPLTNAAGAHGSRANTESVTSRDSWLAEAKLDRLLSMMARWWDGWTVAHIAREYGVTRQRAASLLTEVGCTRARWRRGAHDRADSRRRATPMAVREAQAALLHPLAHRLTVRQRAALAWRALGLASPDIARRMLTTPQNVRHFQIAGYLRLKRLERARHEEAVRASGRARSADAARSAEGDDMRLEWGDLLAGPNGGFATEEAPRPDGQGA
jgi:transcriptional regulator